jgi:hypothetical protein
MKATIILVCFVAAYNCRNIPMSTEPPRTPNGTLSSFDIPQFVMLTYDDAVTVANYPTYSKLFDRRNKENACPIGATFFLSHENTNYQLVHELYRRGYEIASHSVTHHSNTQYWKNADKKTLIDEITGLKKMVAKFADININDVKGYRAPFLQTTGNTTFQVLHDEGFKYDSSMPTLSHSKPKPIFPYNLDDGYQQDCQISPCPTSDGRWEGLFIVPIVDYWRKRLVIDGPPPIYQDSPCSMVDFCLPDPVDNEDTFQYFKTNFDRHYTTNRAPFPVFLHEAWLKIEPFREQGYFEFIDYLLTLDDVYIVTIQEVIHWMENPVPLSQYKQTKCVRTPAVSKCQDEGITCPYIKVPELHKTDKSMVICNGNCPTHYPWVNNTLGA